MIPARQAVLWPVQLSFFFIGLQVWMEWSCLDQDMPILPQISNMKRIIRACDVLLTPVVDRPDHATVGVWFTRVGAPVHWHEARAACIAQP